MEYLIAIAFVFFIGGLMLAVLQGIYPKNSHKDKK